MNNKSNLFAKFFIIFNCTLGMTSKRKKAGQKNGSPEIITNGFLKQNIKIIGIVCLGFAIRLLFYFENSNNPLAQLPVSDGEIYWNWTAKILAGNLSTDVLFMSPVYPLFLAGISLFTGLSISFIYMVQIFLSTLTILFIYLSSKKLFTENTGLAASLLFALCGQSIFYTQLILSETLQMFIISMLMFETVSLLKDIHYKRWIIAGALSGIAILIRPNFILAIMCTTVLYYFLVTRANKAMGSMKPKIQYLIGVVIFIFPLTIYNYSTGGSFTLFTANSGINLWIGNNIDALGVFKKPAEFNFDEDMTGKIYAEKATGKELTLSEVDDFWKSKTIDAVFNAPDKALIRFGQKILLFFSMSENPQSTYMDINFSKHYAPFSLSLSFMGYFLFLLLAGIGLYFGYGNKVFFNFFLWAILFYALATAVFFVTGRFRMGLLPILALPAGYGIIKIGEAVKEKRYKSISIALIVPLFVLLADGFITPHFTFNRDDIFLQVAANQFANGAYEDALSNYKAALSTRESPDALMGIANILSVKGDVQQAEKLFHQVISLSKDNYMAYFNIGLLSAQQQKFDLAEKYFLKAKELNKEFYETDRNLAVLYHLKEDYRHALIKYEEYLPHAINEQVRESIIEDIRKIKTAIK
ncbi:MAG: glycosyltransferase family 39 protein [Ignavibacteriales bacterium]|nr:glycosyltransferase family 39 protein [Ignavibacteriales bacterium]